MRSGKNQRLLDIPAQPYLLSHPSGGSNTFVLLDHRERPLSGVHAIPREGAEVRHICDPSADRVGAILLRLEHLDLLWSYSDQDGLTRRHPLGAGGGDEAEPRHIDAARHTRLPYGSFQHVGDADEPGNEGVDRTLVYIRGSAN